MRTRTSLVGVAVAALLSVLAVPAGASPTDDGAGSRAKESAPTPPAIGGTAPIETHSEDIVVAESGTSFASSGGDEQVLVNADVPTTAVIGVTWDGDGGENLSVGLRSLEAGSWTDWTEVEVDPGDGGSGDRVGTEAISVLNATEVEVRLTAEDTEVPADAVVHVIDPGESSADSVSPDAATSAETTMGDAGPTALAVDPAPTGVPAVLSRADWGADEAIRTWRPSLGRVTGAVIHHTAGRNDYTEADVPAILRGIYRYHAVSLGWGDIGYNALVDRFGRIWEGRFGGLTHPVTGGHAVGVNSTTFGIAVMGEFTSAAVPEPAMHAVAQMTAWKLALHGVTPDGAGVKADGSPMPARIVGHRDVQATLCPGDAFYARMSELRSRVAALYPTMPRYAQRTPYAVRLAGADRYATSAATSQWIFRRSQVVYVATGVEYPDALAATPAAALTNSPVLLVRPDSVPAATAAELRRLQPSTIRVLGGPAAVSSTALAELGGFASTVEIVAGPDRYATAVAVSESGWATTQTVYLASGQSAPDALGAAAAAAQQSAPLLLVRTGGLPQGVRAELARLAPDEVVVVGGRSVLSDAVRADVLDVLPGARVVRVGGADRYATSALLVDRLWTDVDAVFHATGANWPDALSASSAAAEKNAPVLLLRQACTPDPVREVLRATTPALEYVLGGVAVVADAATRTDC